MNFQDDYCVVDGNPCQPESLYCSEECRQRDEIFSMDNCTAQSVSPLIHPEEPPSNPLLYECCPFTKIPTSECDCEQHMNTHVFTLSGSSTSLQEAPRQLNESFYASLRDVSLKVPQDNYKIWLSSAF